MNIALKLIAFAVILSLSSCSSEKEEPAPSPPNANPTPTNPIPPINTPPKTGVGYSLDSTFKHKGELVTMLAIQPDGRMIIANPTQITRINKDGTLDPSFAVGTTGDGEFHSLALMADGKVLLGGTFKSYNGINKPYLVRLGADGSLDNNFSLENAENQVAVIDIEVIRLMKNGKIMLGGPFSYHPTYPLGNVDADGYMPYIIRIGQDGAYDPTFGQFRMGLGGSNVGVKDIYEMPDGKLLVTGSMLTYYYYPTPTTEMIYSTIVKLNPDGSLDPSFKFNGGITLNDPFSHLTPYVKAIYMENDGKVVLLGHFSGSNNTPAKNYSSIMRLTTNGEVDLTFPKLGGRLNTSTALVGGNRFIGVMQNPKFRLQQATPAYIVTDENWVKNEELNNDIPDFKYGDTYAMAVDGDGNLVMAGLFNTADEEGNWKSLIRLVVE